MRITLSELRSIVQQVLLENRGLPTNWYHGSPHGDMGDISSFQGDLMFLTDSQVVAKQYNKELIDTGRKPAGDVKAAPITYTINLKFGDDKVFDTRNKEHLAIFAELVKEARIEDPDDPLLRKSDLMSAHPAPGSSIGGTFPSYGCARTLLPKLAQHGFVASLITEGAQGVSLAVTNPSQNLSIASRA